MEKEVDVLVVEDSDDDYEIVSHVFDDEHVRYLHVKNGPDALRYIFSASPVVIFSSTDDTREIGQAYELGANGFVVKPMGFEKFVSTVKAISM